MVLSKKTERANDPRSGRVVADRIPRQAYSKPQPSKGGAGGKYTWGAPGWEMEVLAQLPEEEARKYLRGEVAFTDLPWPEDLAEELLPDDARTAAAYGGGGGGGTYAEDEAALEEEEEEAGKGSELLEREDAADALVPPPPKLSTTPAAPSQQAQQQG